MAPTRVAVIGSTDAMMDAFDGFTRKTVCVTYIRQERYRNGHNNHHSEKPKIRRSLFCGSHDFFRLYDKHKAYYGKEEAVRCNGERLIAFLSAISPNML